MVGTVPKVTEEEAVDLINSKPFVYIVWVEETCPTCAIHLQNLYQISLELTDWTFAQIGVYNYVRNEKRGKNKIPKLFYFEPAGFPAGFIFREGRRVRAPIGYATVSDMTRDLKEIERKDYKSPEDIEKELLDALR